MERDCPKIVILGSGNVATHLAQLLDKTCHIAQIWSRDISNATKLCSLLKKSEPVAQPSQIITDADFYLIAVSDDAIQTVASHLTGVKGIVAHTSGSVGIQNLYDILEKKRCGVFYPLQTFTKSSRAIFSPFPIFIEGDSPDTLSRLKALALHITNDVREADSLIRSHIHLAAIFANNFANYLWDVADQYLCKHTPFDITILQPLLSETLQKVMSMGPHKAQTGPARRNDTGVISSHLSKLEGTQKEIYEMLTQSIIKDHHQIAITNNLTIPDEQNRL